MKRILLPFFVLVFLLFSAGVVRAGVIVYPVETNIFISSSNITLTVEAGSSADSVVVNGNNLVVAVSAPDIFTIRSDNKYNLTNDSGIGVNCGDSSSTLTIQPSSGQQTVTIAPSTGSCSSSSSSSSSGPASVQTCNNGYITNGVPDLFEIRTSKNSATLYFAPPTMPYSNFYIAYTKRLDIWEYAVQFNQGYSSGVLQYTINSLEPGTKYFFIIKPGNGCVTGNWSNTMAATTTLSGQGNYYKNLNTSIAQKFKAVINNIASFGKASNNLAPTSTPKPTELPQTYVNKPTTVPVQTPEYTPIPISQPTPKPKFCILWWCFY